MQKTDSLIRTKLRLPFTRPELVPRPRLQERIAEGLLSPLTLVIAPAGFGKTTLVASCVIGCGMPVAWLSLDRGDNQEGLFLNYLIAAIQGADHRIGGEAAQLMTGMQPASPDAVLTSLSSMTWMPQPGRWYWCWMTTSLLAARRFIQKWCICSNIARRLFIY